MSRTRRWEPVFLSSGAKRRSAAITAAVLVLLGVPASAAGITPRPDLCAAEARPDLQAELRAAVLARRASIGRDSGRIARSPATDIGDVAVIEDDGTMMVGGLIVWERVVQEFYRTHTDSYDVLAVFGASTYPTDLDPGFNALAFEFNVRNDVAGIGVLVGLDENATVGIDTQRLKSVVNMNDLVDYGATPTDLLPSSVSGLVTGVELLAHEVGHMMSAYTNVAAVVPGADILGSAGHWSYLLDGEGSVLYSPRWQDNLDGTFTALEVWSNYSQLDQYVLGMRAAADVSPRFVIATADTVPRPLLAGSTVSGTRIDFTIDDLIAQNGARIPDAATAQHDYRIALALFVPGGTSASQADLDFMSAMGPAWADWFFDKTGGIGTMDATLAQTPVVAAFDADVPRGNGPLPVRFRNLSWGTITGHTWNFGDGSPTSSDQNPTHTYTTDGVYTVSLTVDGFAGPSQAIRTGLVRVGGYTAVFSDDFETDQGWTVGAPNTATTGNWERGDPEGTTKSGFTVQPEDDHSAGGTQAWVTGLAAGAQATSFDVDQGETTLYSPVLDLAGTSDPLVSYARWFSNNVGNKPAEEPFTVEISDDDGNNWTTLESLNVSSTSAYSRVQFRIADFVTPSTTVQFRFIAADALWPGLVEAAIDDFEVLIAGPAVVAPVTAVAARLSLEPARPNPFHGGTTVRYMLPALRVVDLAVFDAGGRRIRTITRGARAEGRYAARWDGRNDAGRHAGAGVYWIRLRAGDDVRTRRAVLLR